MQFFFFQAEDGIRDLTVTGVQTCALPISVALIAPIETPDTTSGRIPLSSKHSTTPSSNAPNAPPPCKTSPVIAMIVPLFFLVTRSCYKLWEGCALDREYSHAR